MTRYTAIICASGLLLLCLGIVGSMDVADAQAAQNEYCDMVASGAWPDFNNNYERVCAGRER